MDFDLTKIGEEEVKLHGMTREQSKGEVQYKMALKMLDILMGTVKIFSQIRFSAVWLPLPS